MSQQEHKHIMLLVIIVDNDKCESVLEFLEKRSCHMIMHAHGKGTARSEILTMLGLGQSDKAIAFGIIKSEDEENIFERLDRRFDLGRPGHGIAFTVDIGSVSGKKALEYLCGVKNGGESNG